MLRNYFVIVTMAASLVIGSSAVRAQDAGALLDLLVKKRILTDQEAEEVRGELTKDAASTAAGKLKLSTPITELELYGDARVRYEVRTAEAGSPDFITPAGEHTQRNRARYRLRLGLRGTLADDWFFGLRLETSSNSRSTNVTIGDEASGGPFSKGSDGINVGQAYVGYKGIRDVTLTAGRMPNPLVTTSMLWDADINPEGIAEQWKHTFNFSFGGGTTAAATDSKDGKTVAAVTTEPTKFSIDLFANLAQFIYDDSNPEDPVGARGVSSNRLNPNTDAYLLAWQVGAKFNFTKDIYLQLAPTLYNYTGAGDTFNVFFSGDPAFRRTVGVVTTVVSPNQTGINSLLVFDVPMEFGWKVGELPMRIFGDFAVNLEADARATAAGHPDKGDQRYAYQIGLGIGKIKQKHDWQIQGFYQHVEQFALDPNLVDSDLYDSRVNMEGFAVQAGYAISDAVVFNLTYGYGQQADRDLGTGGTGDAFTLNPLRKYNIFQADLNVKF
ncbi:MAG: putative porin [Verrucomicrobiota bacterium]|nr:putative porin [Verrucomicrobiota bacterium]